ncbi:MAG: hypothetical protein HY327_07210 [Chloroflexi bacterium]|nr:hypothetical protein [Chloroflexota bacterium]
MRSAILREGDQNGSPVPTRRAMKRWRSFFVRLALAMLVAAIIASIPIPRLAPQTWLAYIQVPLVVFGLVCFIGKLLIDTFFYDRYSS